MTSTLTLAARLRTLADAELQAAIRAREISGSGIHDFFDLAEALLDRDNIQRALARLDRLSLAAIAAAAQGRVRATSVPEVIAQLVSWGAAPEPSLALVTARLQHAAELLLVENTDQLVLVYDAVREVLAAWPERGLPSGAELAASGAPGVLAILPSATGDDTDRLASEHAFAAVTGVSELVTELVAEPAHELQKGGLALPSVKRLANALSVPMADVAGMLSIAARAGLVTREGRLWLATDAATAWQHRSTSQRWSTLAAAWIDALPADIRTLLAQRARAPWGSGLQALVAWNYPAGGGDIQQRVSQFAGDAELLGLTAHDAPSSAGTLLLENSTDDATRRMHALFPSEVEKVYLQHDLSIVAPGPLAPEIDSRLRTVADVEGRALASAYRISESSVNRAISMGETEASLLAFLGEISLTGIPQPLNYLVAETARRYGRVRVGSIVETADAPRHESRNRSYIASDDANLLHTLEVDQAIAALGLVRDDGRLVSRFARDEVFWALTDARYPVAAEDGNGVIVNLRRGRTVPAPRPVSPNTTAALVTRLRAAETEAGPDAARAWLARQLEIAVRARVALIVSVVMPDGRVVEYALEPTGVGGGRLRGRDRQADIERTLPLSSISGIRPAEDAEG